MNKKLKLYCTLFVVALIWTIVSNIKITRMSTSYGYDDIKQDGWSFGQMPESYITRDTIYENGGISTSSSWATTRIPVKVKHRTGSKNYLLSTVGGKTRMVDLDQVTVILPAEKNSLSVSLFIIWAVTAIVMIWILCLAIKIIRSIRRGEIFVTKVAGYLETIGLLLSADYVIGGIVGSVWYHAFLKQVELADYYVTSFNSATGGAGGGLWILTGLGLMIISQIILMGKDLKEEQDLTI